MTAILHVLVIEGHSASAWVMETALGDRGVRSTLVRGMGSAVVALAHRKFDAVLLDLAVEGSSSMENSSGVHAITRLREETPIPIIVVSTIDSISTAVLCVRTGAAGYVVTHPERLFPVEAYALHQEIVLAIEREERLATLRELLRRGLLDAKTDQALRGFIDILGDTLQEVSAYLERNYPAAQEHFEATLHARGASAALQELGALSLALPAELAESVSLIEEMARMDAELRTARKVVRRRVTSWLDPKIIGLLLVIFVLVFLRWG